MLENRLHAQNSNKKEDLKNITYVCIENIRPNPYQPRKQFNKTALEELCESIKQYGVIQPINVRKITASSYELVAGERKAPSCYYGGIKRDSDNNSQC
jgi:ParB family chromosome partitioning protein